MMNRLISGKPADQRLIEGVVGNLPLFWGVPPQHLAAVVRQCWIMPARRGDRVLEQGARPPGILAVAYGTLKLVLRRNGGAERVLRLVPALRVFGESSALLGRGSPYDAVALEDTKLAVIPVASVFALLESDPRFARRLVLLLAERKGELYAELEAAALLSGAQRLATYLKELAGSNGARTISLPFSKTLFAARLGIKKETLSRLLRDLVEQRVIDVARREIAILEPVRLEELAEKGRLDVTGSGHS